MITHSSALHHAGHHPLPIIPQYLFVNLELVLIDARSLNLVARHSQFTFASLAQSIPILYITTLFACLRCSAAVMYMCTMVDIICISLTMLRRYKDRYNAACSWLRAFTSWTPLVGWHVLGKWFYR
ncbi:hypothetical protein JB92DRAFT_2008124 [Gautieria morchelliformis]|nr:hypothetical protein JB92DRAFT_2008124 [Gautieria morchelliformis]